MADAIVSAVAERLVSILEEQIRSEFNLVTGVEKKIRNLSSDLNRVRDMLVDADRRGFQDKSIKKWLKRLEDTSYEMDDILDEWSISLRMEQPLSSSQAPPKQKVCPFIPSPSCLCFKKVATRRDIAMKIKNVKAKLDIILEEEKQYIFLKNQGAVPSNQLERVSTSFVEVKDVKGREDDKEILVQKLIENGASQSGINLISIVGTGGIGKTTLAQLVYNDSRVENYFPLKIWICVSDPFDEVKIAKEIVEQVRKSTPSTNQLEMLLKDVIESVSGKKFLLVLDDVWTEDNTKWGRLRTCLKHGEVGSSVLVTMRNEKVAVTMGATKEGIYRLGQLSDEDCWLLLHRIAFFGRSEEGLEALLDIGRKVANKCKGLPLAAKFLGSLLRFKNNVEAWENVLNSETWQFKEAKLDLFPHLVLSYNDLPPVQKRCFSYCAVFPKDHVIDVKRLIRNWMALGYLSYNGDLESELELRGQEYFDNLEMRSLFQDFVKDNLNSKVQCKMHDIVHDFAQFLRESDDLKNLDGGTSNCKVCDPLLVSRVKEYRSLICGQERPPYICDCLTILRVLSLRRCAFEGVPIEIEKLIHLRDLDLSESMLTGEDIKSICKLFNLQTLLVSQCEIIEIPTEIGNLVQLRHLDMSYNTRVKKLPESICCLCELRSLNVKGCYELSELPKGIHNLIKLKVLENWNTKRLNRYPQGFSQLTGLQEIDQFCGGSDWTKLGYLKELNRLSGYLILKIRLVNLDEEVVEDAREAELVKKIHIQTLFIEFVDENDQNEEPLCMEVLDALRPHANLQAFVLWNFKGSKLPSWIISPHYQLREIGFFNTKCGPSLPPFGMLPCLERLSFDDANGLEFLGREFLGITSSSPSSSMVSSSSSSTNMIVGFPKLVSLEFSDCPNWKEWEDITVEEEKSATLSVMPCLSRLRVWKSPNLTGLPHRLLRKVTSLKNLELFGSTQLVGLFEDREDPFRKLISHIPQVDLEWVGFGV